MKGILIISIDSIGTMMSGAGLRYLSLAQELSKSIDVTLAVPNDNPPKIDGISVFSFNPDHLKDLNDILNDFENVLVSGIFALRLKGIEKTNAKIIVDLYDPIILENLFYENKHSIKKKIFNHFRSIQLTNHLAKIGDFFICGSERQRDFWLGVLAANGRINPVNFELSSDFRNLIDVVGFGLTETKFESDHFLRKHYPQIEVDAKIVLWGGGVWDWLNPIPLIKIWKNILAEEPKAKLVFLGIEHPNPSVPKHKIVDELISEAKLIGEFEKSIFFINWLSLDDRKKLLSESKVGVTLHKNHIETHFSIRTRVIDYIWARIPILISEGDITSEWVKKYNLGEVVPFDDENQLEKALIKLLSFDKNDFHHNFDEIRTLLFWDQQIKPLKNFCKDGKKTLDKQYNQSLFYGNISRHNINYLITAIKLGQTGDVINKIRKRFKI